MRIDSSSVLASSFHLFSRREKLTESLQIRGGASNVNATVRLVSTRAGRSPREASLEGGERPAVTVKAGSCSPGRTDARYAKLKTLVEYLVEAITGRKLKIKLVRVNEAASRVENTPMGGTRMDSLGGGGRAQAAPGFEYSFSREVEETEWTDYLVSGTVRTADGREISFRLHLSLKREEAYSEGFRLAVGEQPRDPLVVVLDGSYARLSGDFMPFDLDMDGVEDMVPLPSGNAGFLVLDLNGDGTVNDGSELFGPRTGNGFLELSSYDSDGNGWIDEADPAFHDLRVWIKTPDGESFYSLPRLGIGALYLESLRTPFVLQDGEGEAQGNVSRTSFWLGENGGAGLVQHVDLFL